MEDFIVAEQIAQIRTFLSGYDPEIVRKALEMWLVDMGLDGGLIANIPLADRIDELEPEVRQDIIANATKASDILPNCAKCGRKMNISGVCPDCAKGKAGYKSRLFCVCGSDEYFTTPLKDKIEELIALRDAK